MWTLLLLLVATPSLAAPEAVVRGDDVVAWRGLLLLHPLPASPAEADVAAWRAFTEQFAASPLAEGAWGRLAALGQLDPAWEDRPAMEALGARWEAHQDALRRVAVGVAPGRLTPDGQLEGAAPARGTGGPRIRVRR